MIIKRGDVVYLRKDTGCPNAIRPYVIVSNDVGNKYAQICLGVPLTLKKKNGLPTHCKVSYNDSTAMTEQICVINKDDIEKILFTVDDEDMATIDECLLVSLALGSEPDV